MLRLLLMLTGLLAFLVGCGPRDSSTEAPDADPGQAAAESPAPPSLEPESSAFVMEGWDVFVNRFIEEHLAAHPAWAVMQGRHEFDGQLPDWSADGIRAEVRRLRAARNQAYAYPGAQLSDQQVLQREYLVARIDHDLFWAEKVAWPFRNPQFYLGWMNDSLDPAPYITLDYAPIEERMAAFTRYLEAIPRAAAQIRENLKLPMPRTWLDLGVSAFGGYATYFRDDVPAIWSSVRDEALQARFAAANEQAIVAMQDLADWLLANRDSATEQYALGPDLFQQMLWDTERVDVSIDELEAIGRLDMQRNLAALQLACLQFSPGSDLPGCFEKMAARKPEPDAVSAARRQLEETRRFLEQQQLVSIPGSEVALVDEAPPYARSNSAYINIPGPWEENQPSVYYISPPDPSWPEAVQADYVPGESDLLFTSVHEVWPGHFLNFLHANRARWLFGRAFVGYAFGEGWAHYTEEMMLEAGLRDADPETRIGQLSNALLRNARFLSAIGLHARGWTVEQARQFFVEEAYQSEGTAIQQAARGTYDPAFLNYTMGKLLIRQLREDWTAERGGREAWKAFHDEFLSFGGPPIPLVREQMMDEPGPRAVFPRLGEAPRRVVDTENQVVLAWQCDDDQYRVTSQEGEYLWLFMPEGTVRLTHNVAASGVHYAAGRVHFRSKGEEALIDDNGKMARCTIDHAETPWEVAKLGGADFRALGNEPGWELVMYSDRPTVLVTHYGEYRYEFMTSRPKRIIRPGPEGGASALGLALGANNAAESKAQVGSLFRSTLNDVVIEIELMPGPCLDTMADVEFETQVIIRLGPETLTGCGRALH